MDSVGPLTFKTGERIFSEGQPGDCAYIIESGAVDILARVGSDAEVVIGQLRRGELFGEMALVDSPLRSASAVAREDTELVVIPRAHFEARIDVTDKLVRLFMKVLMERYREMRGHFHAALAGGTADTCPPTVPRTYAADAVVAKRRVEAEARLRNGFERGELELFYQPIMAAPGTRLAGCEALIRWRDPDRGLVPPIEFIGLAEESGLIVAIGRWILEEACNAWRRINSRHGGGLYVSINLSGRQFESPCLVAEIDEIFARTEVDPDLIKLEVTESLLMANPLQAAEMLTALTGLGTHIALDDFGTGYSSFSYLHRFPIDALKIDRAFVSTMSGNHKSREIVRTLCSLARAIGMATIAEGVETAEEADALCQFGADYLQGYRFSKPLPEAEFLAFIDRCR